MSHRLTDKVVHTEAELRALIGHPSPTVTPKLQPRLTALTRVFIERSPWVAVATTGPGGRCDVSPRGDPRGFVRILDDQTLLLPERPGNRIADTLTNLLVHPYIGLLFVIPGLHDTFRVNGRATLTTDPALLTPSAVEGGVPKLGILIDVEEAFTQCGKASLRSHLWDPAGFQDRADFPTAGQLQALFTDGGVDANAYDAARAERYARREGFYDPSSQ